MPTKIQLCGLIKLNYNF